MTTEPPADAHDSTDPSDATNARRRPRRGTVIGLAVAAVALVTSVVAGSLALASTTASPGDSTGTAPTATRPGASPTPTATGTPSTPTPSAPSGTPLPVVTFDPPAAPASVLPIDCAGLVPESVRVRALGDAGQLHDTGGPAIEEGIVAVRQAGLLRCVWFSAAQTASLEVSVLPDDLDGFRAYSQQFGPLGSTELGPDSRVQCDVASATSVWGCRGGFAPSGHWVEFLFGGAVAGAPAPQVVLSELTNAVSASLAAAGTPRFPATGAPSVADCSAIDAGGLRAAVGEPSLAGPSADVFGLTMMEAAFRSGGLLLCTWSGGPALSRVTVSVVPGGGWGVLDEDAAAARYPNAAHALIRVPGAQAASITAFSSSGFSIVRASVNGTLVTVQAFAAPGSPATTTIAAQAAAALTVALLAD